MPLYLKISNTRNKQYDMYTLYGWVFSFFIISEKKIPIHTLYSISFTSKFVNK